MLELTKRHGVPLGFTGHPALSHLSFEPPTVLALQTLMTVRLLERGFPAGACFYPSLSHESRHVEALILAGGGRRGRGVGIASSQRGHVDPHWRQSQAQRVFAPGLSGAPRFLFTLRSKFANPSYTR